MSADSEAAHLGPAGIVGFTERSMSKKTEQVEFDAKTEKLPSHYGTVGKVYQDQKGRHWKAGLCGWQRCNSDGGDPWQTDHGRRSSWSTAWKNSWRRKY